VKGTTTQKSTKMHLSVLSILVAVTGAVAWKPAKPSYICSDFSVSVPVNNITTLVPFLPEIQNEYQATFYSNALLTRGDPRPSPSLTTLTTSFNITATYCHPRKPGPRSSTLHLLTHGLGFNRSYWDFYLPGNSSTAYSYVNAATAAGYSTLSWNRLGHAPSTEANPYTEIQATVELAVLAGFTTLARTGRLPLPKPSKVVHVGVSVVVSQNMLVMTDKFSTRGAPFSLMRLPLLPLV
jgi:hypothetical protein